MRYFIVSDIHGNYDKLQTALTASGFDENEDTLISVGDAFDRGTQNSLILNYLVNLPHKILLWGNHDARLAKLIDGTAWLNFCDDHNGTTITIEEFAKLPYATEEALEILNKQQTPDARTLQQYFKLCKCAIEFPDMYITHGWLPHTDYDQIVLYKDWKTIATTFDIWYRAMWADTEAAILDNAWPDKTMLVGHWHAWRIAEYAYGEKRINEETQSIDTSTYISADKKIIAIDGCTNAEFGQVNVYVYETDAQPIIYNVKRKNKRK